jgi:hypothetical protein
MYTIPETSIRVEPTTVKSVSISQLGQQCLKRSYRMAVELVDGNVIDFDFTCYNPEYAMWLLNDVEENTLRQR